MTRILASLIPSRSPKPAGADSCSTYNNVTLPNHLADNDMYSNFETVMSCADCVYVSTTVRNTASGPELLDSFFNGLAHLLALLKQQVRFVN